MSWWKFKRRTPSAVSTPTGTDATFFLGDGSEGSVAGSLYKKESGGDISLLTGISQAAADAAYQPVDADLTAIAALTTTPYGRALLTLASQAALSGALAVATPLAQGAMSAADKAQEQNFSTTQVNILDFAADQNPATLTNLRNGTTDIAAALAAAVAALPSGGKVVFPPGVYSDPSGVTVSTAHITLEGAARYNTVFLTASTTADMLTLNQYYITVQGFTFTGPGTGQAPTRTAGYAVNVNPANAAYAKVRDCSFTYQFDCVNIGCTLMDVTDLELRFFKRNGLAVTQNSDHRITVVTADNNTGALPTGAAISVTATASLVMDQLNLIHSNNVLDIAPAGGVTIPSIKATNCFFDTSVTGLNMTAAGFFYRSEFTNCWFSSMSSAGVRFGPTTAGGVDGITFVNCDIYNNVGGTTNGVHVSTANVGKWKMMGCSIAGWTSGITLTAGAAHFPTIIANTIGAVSAFGVNATGITVGAGTYKGLMITDNDVVDNTAAISLGVVTPTAGQASSYRITDNAGINPRGAVTTPAVPASTVAVTNTTGFRVSVYMRAGTITAITVNGVVTGVTAAPSATGTLAFVLEPGGTIAMTYSVVPTWVWVGM